MDFSYNFKNNIEKTAPFSMYYFSKDQNFGYYRIAKNGSSAFSDTLGLDQMQSLSTPIHDQIFCTLRDPKSRLLSSIFETLFRYRYDDVNILHESVNKKEIFYSLKKINVTNNEEFIKGYLNLINDFSFFDSHHAPQHYYLFKADGSVRFNFKTFDVFDMQEILANKFKVSEMKKSNRLEIYAKPPNFFTSHGLKYKLNFTRRLNNRRLTESQLNKYSNVMLFYPNWHPLPRLFESSFNLKKEYVGYNFYYLKNQIAKKYIELKKDTAVVNLISEFTEENYKEDLNIYNNFKSSKKNIVELKKLI